MTNLITVNMRALALKDIHLQGQLSSAELEMDNVDELIRVVEPIRYEIDATLNEEDILLRGSLETVIECECGRCLGKFRMPVELLDWACLLALEGEEKVEIVNDTVDLTPFVREDMLIEFPLHPQCGEQCPGVKTPARIEPEPSGLKKEDARAKSPWDGLDQLKLD